MAKQKKQKKKNKFKLLSLDRQEELRNASEVEVRRRVGTLTIEREKVKDARVADMDLAIAKAAYTELAAPYKDAEAVITEEIKFIHEMLKADGREGVATSLADLDSEGEEESDDDN